MDAYSSLVKNDLVKQRAVVNGTTALHSVLDATLAQSFLCLQIYYSPEPVRDFVVLPRVEGASRQKGCNEVLSNWKHAGHLSSKARRQGRALLNNGAHLSIGLL